MAGGRKLEQIPLYCTKPVSACAPKRVRCRSALAEFLTRPQAGGAQIGASPSEVHEDWRDDITYSVGLQFNLSETVAHSAPANTYFTGE